MAVDTNNTNRKVVLVKGDKSKGYEQAIFILRTDGYKKTVDSVKEAERNVSTGNFAPHAAAASPKFDYSSYARAEMLPPQKASAARVARKVKKRNSFDVMLNLALIVTGIAVVALFAVNFL